MCSKETVASYRRRRETLTHCSETQSISSFSLSIDGSMVSLIGGVHKHFASANVRCSTLDGSPQRNTPPSLSSLGRLKTLRALSLVVLVRGISGFTELAGESISRLSFNQGTPRLQHIKHRCSCYKGAFVACLGDERNFSGNTSGHTPNSPSRRLGNSGGLLKYTSAETDPILQAPSLQHWFKNWQTLRKHKLTASTFAGAIGFWRRRRAQLWLEKIGAIEPFSGNLATCWSNIKEEEALERYKLITGNPVLFPEFQVYSAKSEDNWLAASPDGTIDRLVYELPSRGVLEIKCPYFNGDMSKAFPWSRIPVHYIPQAQGLMEILGRDWMDFYVWTLNGSSLFRLHRDEEYWDVMKIALSDFWWKHVQPARELYSSGDITDPFFQLRSLTPAPRHELCRDIVYKSKHIVDNSELVIREIHGKLRY